MCFFLMMRLAPHRRRNGILCSIPFIIRVGDASRERFPIQKICCLPRLKYDHDERRAPSQHHQRLPFRFHGQIMVLHCSRSIPVRCDAAQHTSSTSCHFCTESYTHAHALGQALARCLCTMVPLAPHETSVSKSEAECSDKGKAEWEMLSVLMRDLKDGFAKGKDLEALKRLVDQLALSAEPTDPRLGSAFLQLARSLEATGEQPSKYLGYARRALRCLETLDGSWEHSVCLFTLGSFYLNLANIDTAVSMFTKCASVIQQIKGSTHDEIHNDNLMMLHHVLGKIEDIRGNYQKSIEHYGNAIRFGKRLSKLGRGQLPLMYFKAAAVCRNASSPEAAMSFAQKALEGFMTCYGPSSLQVGEVRALMSGIHCDLTKYEDALSDYNEAKPILEYLKHTAEIAIMNLDIANLLIYQKKTESALPLLQETIKITEDTSRFHVLALIRAGIAASELKLDTCASDYCQRAVEALDHHEVSCHNAYDLVQLGMFLESRREFKRAEVLFMKIMKWVDGFSSWPYTIRVKGKTVQLESNDKRHMQLFCKKVGVLLFQGQKFKQAIPYLQRSLKSIQGRNGVQLFYMHLNLGTSYAYLNQKVEALAHLHSCKAIVTEWLWLHLINLYYDLSTKNRSVDRSITLENISICVLRLFA